MEKTTRTKNIALVFMSISVAIIFTGLLQVGFEKDLPLQIVLSNAFYGTFSYMGGNGTFNTTYPLYIYISAFTIPIALFYAVFAVLGVQIKHWYYLVFPPKNHIVIVGLSDIGYALFKNIKEKNLFIIDENLNSKNTLSALANKVCVYEDTQMVFKKFISQAKEIYILYDNDIKNINVISKLEKYIDSEVEIYIHLENKTSEILYSPLFEKGTKNKVNYSLNSFNIYQKAIWNWFDKNPIEGIIDTTKQDSMEVSILLVGWDRVIKEALEYLLNLGHFYNEKPINITIAVDEIDIVNQEIVFLYPEILKYNSEKNIINQQLWNIELIDLQEYYESINNDFNFTNIIISLESVEKSANVAYKFFSFHYKELEKNRTKIGYFSDSLNLKKSLNSEVMIETFGNFNTLVTPQTVKSEEINNYSKAIKKMYESTKRSDNISDPWQDSFFTYWSNIYAYLHQAIKQREFQKLTINEAKKENINISNEIKSIFKDSNKEFESKNLNIYIKCLEKIAGDTPKEKEKNLEQFAKVEHTRWNAYHIINGYTYNPVKNKNYKEHDCILDWDGVVDTKFDTLKYDYLNFFKSVDSELNKGKI